MRITKAQAEALVLAYAKIDGKAGPEPNSRSLAVLCRKGLLGFAPTGFAHKTEDGTRLVEVMRQIAEQCHKFPGGTSEGGLAS